MIKTDVELLKKLERREEYDSVLRPQTAYAG
jgi:hypothetical protein